MATPLLATKLVVPPLRLPFVPRPRLLARLSQALDSSFVLISASAGFGKTTLLGDWARHRDTNMPIAWLSLDDGDNDPVRFWDYIVSALKTLHPSFGESTSAMLHSGQSVPADSLLTVLINELSLLPSPFVLVLDDYHVVTAKPIHDGMVYLLDHMPSHMRLVIATRIDPPLPLPHFRGKGMMFEIRTDDLRFSRDEAIALMEAMNAPTRSDEDTVDLQRHTEGWAVGLKMAALALDRQPDVAAFIAGFTGTQRYIMDYLVDEVLERQPGEVRDFLLNTSVLERLTSPLCDALTGRKDSREMLKELERANLFIAPLNESREWYRYDRLFLDLLRHQLEVRSGCDQVAELHRRASQWYEQQGYADEAIDHALDAKDWGAAVSLLHEHRAEKLRIFGDSVTVLNWLRRLPEEVRSSDWELCIVYGHLLLGQGQLDAAKAIADQLAKRATGDDALRGSVALLRTRTALAEGDISRVLELGKEALSLVLPDSLDARSVLGLTLGNFHWHRGHFTEAAPLLIEAYEAGRKAGHRYIAAISLSLLASTSLRGELRRPFDRYREAIELVGPTPGSAVSHQGLGAILYEWNDLEAAVSHIERAIQLGRLLDAPFTKVFLARQHCLLAQCRLAQGNQVAAMKELENACLIAHGLRGPAARAEHAAYHIKIALLLDDLSTASEWGRKLAEDATALHFFLSPIPPRLLIARGEKAKAAERLHALYEENIKGVAQHPIVSVRLYQALATDTVDSALDFLADVLSMTEPEGYIRTFVDEGRLLAPLLRQAVERSISPDYARRLLAIIATEDRQRQVRNRPTSTANAGLLSEREMEVLQLLANGLSDRQIAAKLSVSLGTAKTHVHRILGKLDATSRSHSVTRARELKLI